MVIFAAILVLGDRLSRRAFHDPRWSICPPVPPFRLLLIYHGPYLCQYSESTWRWSMSVTVYVDGFPSRLADEELVNLFSSFGTVLSVLRFKGPSGQPSGYAEVHMAHDEEADKAIHALNGTRVDGELLLVFRECVAESMS